ncbi:hypothetical protein Slin14017_G129100 [Septoria linicola]|nr:hypothetical protein Slin14017_G129100 [Septoria linicola]
MAENDSSIIITLTTRIENLEAEQAKLETYVSAMTSAREVLSTLSGPAAWAAQHTGAEDQATQQLTRVTEELQGAMQQLKERLRQGDHGDDHSWPTEATAGRRGGQ